MVFEEVNIEAYDGFFKEEASVFLTGKYYKNNTLPIELAAIRCFVGRFDEGCIGLIGLLANMDFESPHKAPYGGVRCEGNVSFEKVLAFANRMLAELQAQNVQTIRLVAPPAFHSASQMAIQSLVLKTVGFEVGVFELNHHFCLEGFSRDLSYLSPLDRKTLRRALRNRLSVKVVQSAEDKLAIYDLLIESRRQRGIPLKMSYQHLMHVGTFVELDFWAVYSSEGDLCAGGVVAQVRMDMLHVIYWGFAPSYGHLDANRVLSYHMFEYYYEQGKKYVDIGISTDQGVPNNGLIAFKENIGCQSSLRMEWVWKSKASCPIV